MLCQIKPIIRKEPEPDNLVDVIEEEGEQIAVIVRSYPTFSEAKQNDGIIVEEDIDIQDFLDAREEAQADAETQTAKDKAQDDVTKELAKACDGFAYLFEKYVPMTATEKAAVKVFRDKYAAWMALNV